MQRTIFYNSFWQVSILISVAFLLGGASGLALADELASQKEEKTADLLIVGRMAEVFRPVQRALLVIEKRKGALEFIPAEIMSLGKLEAQDTTTFRYFIASAFPRKVIGYDNGSKVTSFMVIFEDGTRDLLPVERRDTGDMVYDARSVAVYKDFNQQLHEEFDRRITRVQSNMKAADDIARQSARLPNVTAASQLKEKIEALRLTNDDLLRRQRIMESLIRSAYQGELGGHTDMREEILSGQLKNVAQKTAYADRMNRLKKMGQINTLRQRKYIVEEYGDLDIDQLNRELSFLQSQRKELESRLPSGYDGGRGAEMFPEEDFEDGVQDDDEG